MNVKELLISCDIEKTAALHFELQEPPICPDWEDFLLSHLAFIAEIADIQPVPCEYVILGSKVGVGDRTHQEIHMYILEELRKDFRRCQAWDEDRSLESYLDTEVEQLAPDVMDYTLPNSYDMKLVPWEELLGVEVFEKNAETFGRELLAALVIREMSFWGLSYERSSCGQSRFWERIQEAMQNVETSQSTSVEEVLEELKAFADTEADETPTLGEEPIWDAEVLFDEISPTDWARAGIAQYRELLRYVVCSNLEAIPML